MLHARTLRGAGASQVPLLRLVGCTLLLSGCTVGVGSGDWSASLTVGVLAFVLANLLYLLWRLEDHPGEVRRALVFMAGLPLSFLTFLLVEPDADRSWKAIQRREGEDDPERVREDFERELARIRRLRRHHPATPEDPADV